jgi:hypothetical protein
VGFMPGHGAKSALANRRLDHAPKHQSAIHSEFLPLPVPFPSGHRAIPPPPGGWLAYRSSFVSNSGSSASLFCHGNQSRLNDRARPCPAVSRASFLLAQSTYALGARPLELGRVFRGVFPLEAVRTRGGVARLGLGTRTGSAQRVCAKPIFPRGDCLARACAQEGRRNRP